MFSWRPNPCETCKWFKRSGNYGGYHFEECYSPRLMLEYRQECASETRIARANGEPCGLEGRLWEERKHGDDPSVLPPSLGSCPALSGPDDGQPGSPAEAKSGGALAQPED